MVISGMLSEAVTAALVGLADRIGSTGTTVRVTCFLVTCPPSVLGMIAFTLKV